MLPNKSFILIFFFSNLLLSSFYLDTWLNPNTTSRVLQVRSLYEDGTLWIDKYHEETIDKSMVNGHYYPDKAPLPVFLIYSIYNPLANAGILPEPNKDNGKSIFLLGSFVTGSLCFSLILLLIFNMLISNGKTLFEASILSTIPFYASMFFVYAGTFYAHIMVVLFVLMCLELLRQDKQYFLAGLFAGAAFLSEYLTAVIFFIFFFQIIYNHGFKKALLFGLGILPFILSLATYNFNTTGNPLKTLYAYQVYYELQNGGFSWPSMKNLFLMIFSPWRGIIFYTPIVLVFLPLLKNVSKLNLKDWLGNYTILPVVIYFLVLSAFKEWPGGWSYGTRYLMPALGIMIYSGLSLLKWSEINRFLLTYAFGLGIIHAFSAKLSIQYSIPSTIKFPFIKNILPNVLNGNYNDQSILSHMFGIGAQQSAFVFLALFVIGIMTIFHYTKKTT